MEKKMNELKIRPHSEEAERGVLGSALLKPDIMNTIELSPLDFYSVQNAVLWEKLVAITARGSWDAITLGEFLATDGSLERVGGYDRLVELQDSTIVPAYSEHYAGIVRDKAELRRQLEIVEKASERLYKGEDVSDDVVSAFLEKVASADSEVPLDVLANQFIDDCKVGNVGHFKWWCDEWTYKLGKMSVELMIFHAPRSTGKTALMLQWMKEAHKAGQCTPLASIEMLRKALVPRLIANIGDVSTFAMKTRGNITFSEETIAAGAVQEMRTLDFRIRDKKMSVDDIRRFAIQEQRKKPIHAIFIDNLLSINDGGKNYQSKTLMYDDFFRKFRDLRDLLNVPIIVLAHPNAEGGVAWSKDAENFADVILYLQEVPQEGFTLRESGRHIAQRVDVQGKHIMARFQKSRDGIQPIAHLDFIGATQRFVHLGWED